MFVAMYKPRDWPKLASDLDAALDGDGAPILNIVQQDVELNNSIPASTQYAINAVTCVDGPRFANNTDKGAILKHLVEEAKLAVDVAPHFAGLDKEVCHHWQVEPVERFDGPFNHTLANPILVIGNTVR